MRRLWRGFLVRSVVAVPFVALLTAVSLLATEAQDAPAPTQQQPPVFRGEVDVVRLDVSVLDSRRRPVTGLTADDFIVFEDNVLQKVAAVSEIVVADRDPRPTAWMRYAGSDISTNDLVDQLGDGRPYAIVMDDANISADDLFLVQGARAAGREIVSGLAPSDVGAVIYPYVAGNTVDFTTSRARLLDAIDRFEGRRYSLRDVVQQQERPPSNPRTPRTPATPWAPGGFGGGAGGGGADMPARSSPLLARSSCERARPLTAALEVVAGRLALVPNRRKTIVLVSTGMNLNGMGGCDAQLRSQLQNVMRIAQQANINIYSVDVADRTSRTTIAAPDREFLETLAADTGGTVVGGHDEPVDVSVGRIFEEAGSYYLVGYQPSNGVPDGKIRRVHVRVKRPGLTVRVRTAYPAPDGKDPITREPELRANNLTASSVWEVLLGKGNTTPTANDYALTGLFNPVGLPLRLSVVPMGLAAAGRPDIDVAVALSVRFPAARAQVAETLTLVRNLYDPRGRPGSPVHELVNVMLQPSGGDETRHDVFQRLTVAPGRYELRLNARSALLDRSASIFAAFEVPDVARLPLTLSGVALGAPPLPGLSRTDVLAPILPIVLTSARTFTASDNIVALFHIFEGGSSPRAPVTLKIVILDRLDQKVYDTVETIGADVFADGRDVVRQFALPLSKMTTGPHLLTITATRPDALATRRDVVFQVR